MTVRTVPFIQPLSYGCVAFVESCLVSTTSNLRGQQKEGLRGPVYRLAENLCNWPCNFTTTSSMIHHMSSAYVDGVARPVLFDRLPINRVCTISAIFFSCWHRHKRQSVKLSSPPEYHNSQSPKWHNYQVYDEPSLAQWSEVNVQKRVKMRERRCAKSEQNPKFGRKSGKATGASAGLAS